MLLGLWWATLALPAHAQNSPPLTSERLASQSLAATCAACHGTQGRALADAAVPGLAGLPAAYLGEQMKGFKNGARQATVMHQIAKGYSDTQIEQMAAYFAAQKK